ncbi:MAG: SPFH domain-containing protein [Propionicimonas sp.]|uniref:SPFH domain-containing protein n=1 Tax=Propionicimonas sp. TaxID=1955623 RepID=UPI002B21B945|nr:SPFH domain-containing protein [Propionicimonas sp.]MEA4942950.1 SPFH domain-containing protein [Propionicimonas sp.]
MSSENVEGRLTDDAVGAAPAGVPVGHAGARVDIEESKAWTANGLYSVLLCFLLFAAAVWLFVLAGNADAAGRDATAFGVSGVVVLLVGIVAATAITVVSPGDTRVLQFFGRYTGTVRTPGLSMIRPFTLGKRVSVKVRNFETNELKVNDADGNPINIAAIIVWQVADTAKAVFAVENYTEFVETQSEAALRHVASSHPYDNAGPGEESLRGSTDVVAAELAKEVAERITIAGLEVVETRISSLAYAPEIAHAMLQRQQASAVIAAREKIVEGAVSMVEGALRQLEADDVVALDEERKAAMVSNLLVVLCGSSQATPVVNTGTLYA